MKIKRLAVLFVAAMIFVIVAIWIGHRQPKTYTGNIEKVSLGVYKGPNSALMYIAVDKGFLKKFGLDVSVQEYEAGVLAVNDLIAGRVDIATAAEFVLVTQSFHRHDLKIPGVIWRGDDIELIARRDQGIKQIGDLRGKRIGVLQGAQPQFFLGTFLSFNGIPIKNVKIIYLKPSEIVESILEAKIDATVIFSPYTDMIRKRLGTNAIAWSVQSNQDYYFLLFAKEGFIKSRPHVIERLLGALLEAEQFIERHPREGQEVVRRYLNVEPALVLSAWSGVNFQVRLDQDLLILMEHEARWAIDNKLKGSTRLPNYLDFIYIDGLEKIKPEAVTIIH